MAAAAPPSPSPAAIARARDKADEANAMAFYEGVEMKATGAEDDPIKAAAVTKAKRARRAAVICAKRLMRRHREVARAARRSLRCAAPPHASRRAARARRPRTVTVAKAAAPPTDPDPEPEPRSRHVERRPRDGKGAQGERRPLPVAPGSVAFAASVASPGGVA